MESRLATIVVESRLLIREALKSLLSKHSYHVVFDVASTADIGDATISEEPKLVILAHNPPTIRLPRQPASASCGPIARSSCCSSTFPPPIFRSC